MVPVKTTKNIPNMPRFAMHTRGFPLMFSVFGFCRHYLQALKENALTTFIVRA